MISLQTVIFCFFFEWIIKYTLTASGKYRGFCLNALIEDGSIDVHIPSPPPPDFSGYCCYATIATMWSLLLIKHVSLVNFGKCSGDRFSFVSLFIIKDPLFPRSNANLNAGAISSQNFRGKNVKTQRVSKERTKEIYFLSPGKEHRSNSRHIILQACAMQIMKIEKLSSRIPIMHRSLINEHNMGLGLISLSFLFICLSGME